MDKQQHTFEEYMTQARVQPRLVPESEIEEMLGRAEHKRVDGKRSRWMQSMGLGAIALLVCAATYLATQSNQAKHTMPEDISHDPRYQVFVLRDSLTGDSTVVTIPLASAATLSN